MASERMSLGFRVAVFADNLSTKWSDIESTPFGRHTIHPRGGKRVEIQTPQGRMLDIGEKDILHLTEGGIVVSRFTSRNLPEGYKIVSPLKGVGIRPSQ